MNIFSYEIISQVLTRLCQFKVYASEKTFFGIFGNKAHELWTTYYVKCNGDIEDFYMKLNIPDKQKFVRYLQKKLEDERKKKEVQLFGTRS